MKRDSASNAESQLAGSLLQDRPQTQASSSIEVDEHTSCKRIKATQVNGFIVYTRIKRSRFNGCNNIVENLDSKRIKCFEEPDIHTMSSFAETNQKISVKESRAIENVNDKGTVIGTENPDHLLEENMVVDNVAVKIIAGGRHYHIETRNEESPMINSITEESLLVEVVIEESPVVGMVTQEIPVEILTEDSLVIDWDTQEGENIIEDEGYCNLEMPIWMEQHPGGPDKSLSKEGGTEVAPLEFAKCSEVRNGFSEKAPRRFTRSVLKLGDPELSENSDCELPDVGSEVDPNLDGEATAEGSPLTTPWKNMELKMSKKISLNKRPMTVKELFDTGLLDGVSVVYMGSIKSQAFGLRGTIKDGGILCSCSLCNGCRVIPPSKFEIHACKQYRRAAQYICFENGKSLLEVLKACRSSSLHSLEATIRSAISASPEEKSFTCKRCKGSFPLTCLGQVGPLCNSCSESTKSQDNPIGTAGIRARSSEPVFIAKSLKSTSMCISSQNKSRWKITRSSESRSMPKSPERALVSMSSQNKRPWKIKRKSSKPGLIMKSSRSASVCIPSRNKSQWKLTKMSKKQSLISKSFKSASVHISSPNKTQWRITTKDQRLHKLVFEKDGLPDGTEVAYYARGQKLLEGYKKGFGIFCRCCNCEVSPSQFEAHAGWASRRKPYAYIYTSNGVSLHELAISISRGRKFSAKDNDDLCVICADGGNLLLCDGCPRAFHKECVSLSSIPRGDWFCKYCQNKFEREKFVEYNANAVAAGRVSGVDPIEQITRRCIRIVKNFETDLSGCALCRGSDFSKSGFGPRTIIICDQCEKEYHIGCLRNHKMADLKELPKGKWFCCVDCTRIYSTLQKLLVSGAEKIPDSHLDDIKKKCEGQGLDATVDIDVGWRLLSGKIVSPDSRSLLSQALAIFHDCFDPIVDAVTGRNLIPSMVYGKNLKGQDYGGMYCAVLTINSTVVSAGVLRVFGREVAELPLVATSISNHGKGYFKLLFSCIEKLLSFLNVENIVLPAAEEAEPIWMNKFSFERMKPEQLSMYRKICYQMVRFKGTSMLQKAVSSCQIVDRSTGSTEACDEV